MVKQRPGTHAIREYAPIVFWLGLISLFYFFVVTAGTFRLLAWRTDYYDLMVEAWRAGHLYLNVPPSPWLLAQPNPYDPVNTPLWLWDASLYKGHYYLNWGPVPGFCLWLFKFLRVNHTTVYDQWLVLVFTWLRLYAGALLIISYARFAAPRLPSWALQLAVLVFGLASPTPFFLARPLIYEAAIASGQAFLFAGLCCALWGVRSRRWRSSLFVLCGVCLAGAFGSRTSLLLAAPLICLVTALVAHGSLRARFASLLQLGIAPCVMLAAEALHNHLRFDAVGEFGHSYLLSIPQFITHDYWILPNLVSYLTGNIAWSCQFPYVVVPMERQLMNWIAWPVDYNVGNYPLGERVAGVLFATSICWLWVVWPVRAAASGVARVLGRPLRRWSRAERLCLGWSTAIVCAIAPASTMWMANMRFLEDISGGIVLGALGAGFWLLTAPKSRALRALAALVYVGLSLYSIGAGSLLGFTGHAENFGRENPALLLQLTNTFSLCR